MSRTLTAVSGLASSALTLAACLLMSGGSARKPDAEVVAYWADSGHRNRIGIAFALVILACFCFLWFLDGLQLDRLGLPAVSSGSRCSRSEPPSTRPARRFSAPSLTSRTLIQIIVAVAILGFGAQEGWNDRAISSMLTASVALVLAWAFVTAAGFLRRSADLAP